VRLPRHHSLLFVLWCIICLFPVSVKAQSVQGHLVIIGDGGRKDEAMKRFVDLAGGPIHANIIVIPMASSIPDTNGIAEVEILKSFGVKNARYIIFSRAQALQESFGDSLNSATGVFFTGGDQSRLAAVVVGTPIEAKLKEMYRNGMVVGGGSAGAAIMSEVMITGDELHDNDGGNAFSSIEKGNIKTSQGLGFLEDAIIDQHFLKRKRHNRLISAVLEHPDLVGIGIDERTAIIVNPDHTCEVIGKNSVIIYDARNASNIRSGSNNTIGGTNLTMHVLLDGDQYNIRTGQVTTNR